MGVHEDVEWASVLIVSHEDVPGEPERTVHGQPRQRGWSRGGTLRSHVPSRIGLRPRCGDVGGRLTPLGRCRVRGHAGDGAVRGNVDTDCRLENGDVVDGLPEKQVSNAA